MTVGALPLSIAFSQILPGDERSAQLAKPERPKAHLLWKHDTGG